MTIQASNSKKDTPFPVDRGSLAAEIRSARARRDWTQEELAFRAGVNPRRVVQLENGRPVHLDSLLKIVAALEMTLTISEAA